MKNICFRFDVDTHKCLRDGVPKLLKLAKQYDIKFTFFINTGKAVDRSEFIKSKLKKRNAEIVINSLSAVKKLGIKDYLYLSIVNPTISDLYPNIIKDINKARHEIGLHGGKNHETWHHYAHTWDKERISYEISWGMKKLKKINKNIKIFGFSSPTWNGSNVINATLHNLGFLYVADKHSDSAIQQINKVNGINIIPTNILGEPGGVGYLEYARALNMSDDEILEDFKVKLRKRKNLAIMYDHPYYAGVFEISLLKKMVEASLNMNYKFKTMIDISANL